MTSPKEAHPKPNRDPAQSLDHCRLLRAPDAVWPFDVRPDAILAFQLVRRRPVDARCPSLDRLSSHRQLRGDDRAVLARQPVEQRRHCLDARHRPCLRTRKKASRRWALQRRPEVRVLVHGPASPGAAVHRHPDLGLLLRNFASIETQRAAVLIHSLAAIAAIIIWITHVYAAIWVRGSMRSMTQGYVTPGWAWRHHRKWFRALAATGSPGPRSGSPRIEPEKVRASSVRQGGAPPTGKWIGSPLGGVKAPIPSFCPIQRRGSCALRPGSIDCRPDIRSENGSPSWPNLHARSTLQSEFYLLWKLGRRGSSRLSPRACRRSQQTGIAVVRLGAMASTRCSMH